MVSKFYVPSSEVFRNVDKTKIVYKRVSDQEFKRRHELINQMMKEVKLDCLVVSGSTSIWDRGWTHMRWVANHIGCQILNYTYLVFSAKGEISIMAVPMNADMPARRARDIVEDLRGGYDMVGMLIERLKELDVGSGRIGIVEVDASCGIPHKHYMALTSELPNAEFVYVTSEFWKLRAVKSDEEIQMLARCAEIGDRAMYALAATLKPGMQESEIYGIMAHAFCNHGSELPTMILTATTSMHEPDDSFQRERPRDRVLKEGDVIITEVAPRYPDGSEIQTGKPFTLGEPVGEYKRMFEVMLEAYHRVIDALRPGKTDRDVIEAGQVIKDAGYQWHSPLIHSELGGGVSNPVIVGMEGISVPPITFEPNMVFVPELHVADKDYLKGVFICDTVVVTENKPVCLNKYPAQVTVL